MEKPVKSFRLDPELVKAAEEEGINIARLIEATLANVTKTKTCPYCKQKIISK